MTDSEATQAPDTSPGLVLLEYTTAPVTLTPEQQHEVVMALHERRMETDRYIGNGPMQPCGPGCEHCAPRVAHAQVIHDALIARRTTLIEALTVFGDGPCACDLIAGEHWQRDHR